MTKTLESGNIFFLYRPRVEQEEPKGVGDVQRLYMVLDPHRKNRMRRLVVGRKRMPKIKDGGARNWAFVDAVTTKKQAHEGIREEEYKTKSRGTRKLPAARPAGEGVYQIARHDDHTHLAFALELPQQPGTVQKDLNIPEEGSFILSVKNPQKPSPKGTGLDEHQKADMPKKLQGLFRDRRFLPVDPTEFLDHAGIEVLLIGADEDVEDDLGVKLDPQTEDEESSELLRKLRPPKTQAPREPLTQGKWE